jgi:hypothetical protein
MDLWAGLRYDLASGCCTGREGHLEDSERALGAMKWRITINLSHNICTSYTAKWEN